jgi:hypothetical protein
VPAEGEPTPVRPPGVDNRDREMKNIVLMMLALVCALAHADGSVSFKEDVLPLMKTRPAFQAYILSTFTIEDNGLGKRIGGPVMPQMTGARIGPYSFRATYKNGAQVIPVELVIDTDIQFFDKHDHLLKATPGKGDLTKTVKIVETLSGIEINPPMN